MLARPPNRDLRSADLRVRYRAELRDIATSQCLHVDAPSLQAMRYDWGVSDREISNRAVSVAVVVSVTLTNTLFRNVNT